MLDKVTVNAPVSIATPSVSTPAATAAPLPEIPGHGQSKRRRTAENREVIHPVPRNRPVGSKYPL